MYQVRRSCFETNSSSVHTVTIINSNANSEFIDIEKYIVNDDCLLTFNLHDYEYGPDMINADESLEKFKYLLVSRLEQYGEYVYYKENCKDANVLLVDAQEHPGRYPEIDELCDILHKYGNIDFKFLKIKEIDFNVCIDHQSSGVIESYLEKNNITPESFIISNDYGIEIWNDNEKWKNRL